MMATKGFKVHVCITPEYFGESVAHSPRAHSHVEEPLCHAVQQIVELCATSLQRVKCACL